jgi:hypothetical protein
LDKIKKQNRNKYFIKLSFSIVLNLVKNKELNKCWRYNLFHSMKKFYSIFTVAYLLSAASLLSFERKEGDIILEKLNPPATVVVPNDIDWSAFIDNQALPPNILVKRSGATLPPEVVVADWIKLTPPEVTSLNTPSPEA